MDITTILKMRIKYLKTFYIMNVEFRATNAGLKVHIQYHKASSFIGQTLGNIGNCCPYLRQASNIMRLNWKPC